MFSSPRQPAEVAEPGNIRAQRLDTNQQNTPLPYWFGRRWFALTWCCTKVINPLVIKQSSGGGKGGKGAAGGSSRYSGSLAGLVACGPADFCEAVKINDKIVWSADGGVSRDAEHLLYADIVIPGFLTRGRIHWGTSSQAGNWIVLNQDDITHPNYKDQIVFELEGLDFGTSNTPPNVEILLERAADVDGLDVGRSSEGCNPVTGIAEILTNDFYGLGLTDVVDIPTAATLAAALGARTKTVAVPNDPTHTAYMDYQSAFLSERQSLASFIGTILEGFDGWARRKGAKIELGYYPHVGTEPEGLTELTLHDLTEDPDFDAPGWDDDQIITDTIVTGPDRDLDMEESSEVGSNPSARYRVGQMVTKTFARPFHCTKYQRKEQAQELANYYANPATAVEISVRREKSKGLLPGDRFVLNYGPSESRQVFRIVSRRVPARGGVIHFSVIAERLVAPLAYIPAADPSPNLPEPPHPVTIANARVFQFPAFGDYGQTPTVAILAAQPGAGSRAFRVHFSTDDSTYDEIANPETWAIYGTLDVGVAADATALTLNLSAFDLSALTAQSATAQADDSLLAFIGSEAVSIGGLTALGDGQYEVTVLRGRRSTAAAAHDADAGVYVIPRADLVPLQHASFPTAAETRYFKLTDSTAWEEQEIADALKLTYEFTATAVTAPTSIVLDSGADTAIPLGGGASMAMLLATWTAPAVGAALLAKMHVRIQWTPTADVRWMDWGWLTADQTRAEIVGLTPGTEYRVRARAELEQFNSDWLTSDPHTLYGDVDAPNAPANVTATAGTGQAISIAWDAVTGAVEYNLYRNTTNNPATATKLVPNLSAPAFVDIEVNIGTEYFYWVTAEDFANNESAKSTVASATPSALPDPGISDTTPSDPAAPTLASSGTKVAGDGTVTAYLVINLPALPANAAGVNIYYRTTGATGWILSDQYDAARRTAVSTTTIDDLAVNTSIDVMAVAYSLSKRLSNVVPATSSPFTTPDASAPSAPTSLSVSTAAADLNRIPVAYAGAAGTKYGAGMLQWTAPANKDVAYYQVWRTAGTPTMVGRTKGTETELPVYSALMVNPVTDDIYVKAVNTSGVASAASTALSPGGYSFSSNYGPGTLAEQNADNVVVGTLQCSELYVG